MNAPRDVQADFKAATNRLAELRQVHELKLFFEKLEKGRNDLVGTEEFKKADTAEKELLANRLFAQHALAKQQLFERQERDKQAFKELERERAIQESQQARQEGQLLHWIETERRQEAKAPLREARKAEPDIKGVSWAQVKKAEQENADRDLKHLRRTQDEILAKKMQQLDRERASPDEKNALARELEKAFEKQRVQELIKQRERMDHMQLIYGPPPGRGR